MESVTQAPAWALRRLLQAVFAKDDFRPEGRAPRGQEIAIRRVLSGLDAVVLLPTGAGKSLIYQLAGLLVPGVTLVIDPIISLIDDQVDGLRANGIERAVGISSADRKTGAAEEKLARVTSGDAWFVFVAPERLQNQRFRNALKSLARATPINLTVIDEAHCVSEWGHDFRPAYLDLGRVLREIGTDGNGKAPPLLALTGTASRSVLKDVLIELGINRNDRSILVTPTSFDRSELRFTVVNAPSHAIGETVVQVLRDMPARFNRPEAEASIGDFFAPSGLNTMCGIVFCQTVKSPKRGVADIARVVSSSLRIPAPIYAGSSPTQETAGSFEVTKRSNAAAFKASEVPVLFATKAYGMGIDKPNVRFVVHVGTPASIEAYYQEAGRGGRDRRAAQCVLVHSPADRDTHEYFLKESFKGVDQDVSEIRSILTIIRPVGTRGRKTVAMSADSKLQERAIHRLRLLGIVADYVVDFSRKQFELELADSSVSTMDDALLNFVRRSQPGRATSMRAELTAHIEPRLAHRAMHHARRLIEFVYETIVAARTRALDEMLQLASRGTSDALIRDGIQRYLELGGVSERIEPLIDREHFLFEDWTPLFEDLHSEEEAADWRGATARLLESDPDHPGLLLGRALAELLALDGDLGLYLREAKQALVSALGGYAVETGDVGNFLVWLIAWLESRVPHAIAPTLDLSVAILGDEHWDVLAETESRLLTDNTFTDPGTLVAVLERRMKRATRTLDEIQARHLQPLKLES